MLNRPIGLPCEARVSYLLEVRCGSEAQSDLPRCRGTRPLERSGKYPQQFRFLARRVHVLSCLTFLLFRRLDALSSYE